MYAVYSSCSINANYCGAKESYSLNDAFSLSYGIFKAWKCICINCDFRGQCNSFVHNSGELPVVNCALVQI